MCVLVRAWCITIPGAGAIYYPRCQFCGLTIKMPRNRQRKKPGYIKGSMTLAKSLSDFSLVNIDTKHVSTQVAIAHTHSMGVLFKFENENEGKKRRGRKREREREGIELIAGSLIGDLFWRKAEKVWLPSS